MCWCKGTHARGCNHNGEVKHYVANWKLYQIRHKDKKGKKPAPLVKKPAQPAPPVKKPAPVLEPVTVG